MLTAPLFLIGMVAVGIPIAIHLLQLRRYKKVYFSNVDMLEELQNESRKQNNLRRRLILACRILAIVFLVLAFCRPVVPNKVSRLHTGNTMVSVYVDNSYSMECGGMDGSLIESAKQKAREIAAGYNPSVQFQLLTNEASGVQFRWMSREEFLSAVDDIHPSARTVPMSSISMRQYEFLRQAAAANRHAYIVSDFQKTTADLAGMPTDSTIYTTFIPLSGSQVANIYIDSIGFDSPVYYAGATAHAFVRVRNDGDKAVEKLPLRLFAGDKQRALASVDIAAHGSTTATLTFAIDGSEQQGYVEIVDYPITFDDKMYFGLSVNRHVAMLTVGETSENPHLKKLFQGDTLVDYHYVNEKNIDYSHMSDYRFLVIDELHSITTGLQQTLADFSAAGGSLLIIPPAGADESSYNRMLSSFKAPSLGHWENKKMRVERIYEDAGLYRGVFSGRNDEGMEMPTIEGHYALEMQASTVAQPVMQMLDGTPYLTATQTTDGGWVYLVASPLRKEYTDFVQQALFVPTIYNMALFSMPIQMPYYSLSSTEPIRLVGRYEAGEVPHLQSADGMVDVIPHLQTIGGRQCWMPRGEVTDAGSYLLGNIQGNRIPEGEWIALNHSRSESNLDFYSSSEVRKLVREAGLGNCDVMAAAKKSVSEYIRERGMGTPLWRWCLLLCLLSLLAEIILIKIKAK